VLTASHATAHPMQEVGKLLIQSYPQEDDAGPNSLGCAPGQQYLVHL
jgi:hypothetical protein